MSESLPSAESDAGTWQPCSKGPCSAEDGHDRTCAEASGFVAPDVPQLTHALIGVERGRQGAAQVIPEDLALCVSCGWMRVSDYAEHLAAEAFRAGYRHAQAEEDADRPLPVPPEYRINAAAQPASGLHLGPDAATRPLPPGRSVMPPETGSTTHTTGMGSVTPPDKNAAFPCPTDDCPGDGRYPAPGRAHREGCTFPLPPGGPNA